MNELINKIQQCYSIDSPENILNCIQFSYSVINTDDIATLIRNGTQHNLTKYNAGVQPVLIIYDMLGDYAVLKDYDYIVQYSPTDFNIITPHEFVQQFKLIEDDGV